MQERTFPDELHQIISKVERHTLKWFLKVLFGNWKHVLWFVGEEFTSR